MAVYRDMWVYAEQKDHAFLPVTLEMLGEARRLMDKYNADYGADEKVVAVVFGEGVRHLADEAIARGADVVYACDHPEVAHFRLEPYTRIAARMATRKDDYKSYDKPRYFLFPATHNGRDLSATVLAALESGLASDCNFLAIEDAVMTHKFKTGGVERKYERILHMKRPDFSGYEWSTILCLDNPGREFHPQACSIIPASFKALAPDPSRKGMIVEHRFDCSPQELRVRVLRREKVPREADLTRRDVVIALGRGIAKDPDRGVKLGLELAKALGGDVGVSRGVVTAKYGVDASLKQFVAEARQIGETGQSVKPKLYIALGVSGAIQHKKGMDQSGTIVAVNTDPSVPIKEFSDVFVHGDLFDVVPRLITELGNGKGGA